jgi:hypothetical protein
MDILSAMISNVDIEKHEALVLPDFYLDVLDNFMKDKQGAKASYLKCRSLDNEGSGAESVFTLNLIPGFVFKIMDNAEALLSRYRNHIFALQVLKAHEFDLIVIPKVGIITEYNLLIEEQLDITPYHYIQEYYYRIYANKMTNSVKQLTNFLALMPVGDITWRNLSLLNDSLNDDDVKITLYDFDEVGSFQESIFGGDCGSIGLLRCIDVSLFDVISDEIFRLTGKRINVHECRAGKKRLIQIQIDNEIYDYYSKNNITDATHVMLDVNSLQFENHEERLKQMSVDLVGLINDTLDNNRDNIELSLKIKRCIQIEVDELNGNHLYELIDEDLGDETYIDVVFEELKRVGVIFKVITGMSDPIIYV